MENGELQLNNPDNSGDLQVDSNLRQLIRNNQLELVSALSSYIHNRREEIEVELNKLQNFSIYSCLVAFYEKDLLKFSLLLCASLPFLILGYIWFYYDSQEPFGLP